MCTGIENNQEIHFTASQDRGDFSDRYSLAVIDKDYYEQLDDKKKEQTARSFYNDTFLSDQNACPSPRLVYWYEDKNNLYEARTEFWDRLKNIEKRVFFSGYTGHR